MQELKLTDQNRTIGGISHQSIGMRGRAVSVLLTYLLTMHAMLLSIRHP